MSTAYNIYRFAKPNKQELSNIDYFEPYDCFAVYDADGEQTNEYIRLFRLDDEAAVNIINSKFAIGIVLPEKTMNYEKMYSISSFGFYSKFFSTSS